MHILSSALLYLIFMGCQARTAENSRKAKTQNPDAIRASEYIVDQQLKGLLDSMRYCYVRNIKHSNDRLLEFYKKTPEDFKKDSLTYYTAVTSFLNVDSSILRKLLAFRQDSSQCGWIYSHNPYSSTIRKWEMNFNKEMGSKILIYAYIMSACSDDKNIPIDPGVIETIINKIDLNDFSQWPEAHRALTRYELCQKFQQERL